MKLPECSLLPCLLRPKPTHAWHDSSIYLVHDDAKEKEFELEMSWIGAETNGLHLPVPKDLFTEADAKAKAALENFD